MGNRLAQSDYDYLRQGGGEHGIMEILITESFFFYPYFSLPLYFLSAEELVPNLLLIEVCRRWPNYCVIVCVFPLLVSHILQGSWFSSMDLDRIIWRTMLCTRQRSTLWSRRLTLDG
jgi:hypothetical protein